jgi:hypothetical protein
VAIAEMPAAARYGRLPSVNLLDPKRPFRGVSDPNFQMSLNTVTMSAVIRRLP